MGILTVTAEAARAAVSTIPPFIWVVGLAVLATTYFPLLRRAKTPHPDASKALVTQASKAKPPVDDPDAPVSVNYFPSRECDYACGFCFHTNTSGYILPLDKSSMAFIF
ncbi:hypothetical protein CSAL01_01084 [Colletotrichum salicis]|uniref:Uncharacterized protein n=1 Tax=Colletotrichum salicis TaxID=1209931 RepID=A0A135T0B9_9PEZI|nr:hypothetical protein CSAL01_01084 [Colletotrichum salicis]